MEKIPSVLERDFSSGDPKIAPITGRLNPGAEWVFEDGRVVARRKWDGTCVLVDENLTIRTRRMVREGDEPPAGFVPAETDERTGKTFGWEPMLNSSFAGPLNEVIERYTSGHHDPLFPGTYELVGPKINGNPDRVPNHGLVRHDTAQEVPGWLHPGLDVDGNLERACNLVHELHQMHGWEGLVFYHPDGRRAKLKARDVAEYLRVQEQAA